MKLRSCLPLILIPVLLGACSGTTTECQWGEGTPRYMTPQPIETTLPTSLPTAAEPVLVEIGGRSMLVDQVILGPLCSGEWSGTIYVGCNVQVYPYGDQPDFLKDCDLTVAPGSVVYVAYHNDAAYYKGCSCHTGEELTP